MNGPLLVFGAGGQLGQEVLAQAAAQRRAAIGVTRRDADITEARAVAAAIARARPSLIVNAAGYTAVDAAEGDEGAAVAANVTGAATIAEAAARVAVPLVHLSTDYVFDGSKPGAYREGDPLAPLGVYGRTKAAGEAAVRDVAPRHVILRTSWVYGAYGQNFLKTVLRLAATQDTLRIVADQHGCPTATHDLARAIFAIADAARPAWGTYHFAGAGATTWHAFAEAIVAAAAPFTGRRPNVEAIGTADYPTRARRPANSRLDSTLFTTTFGCTAAPWDDRVREAVAALLCEKVDAS